MDKSCLYGIKEVCLKEQTSYNVCNSCVHITLHRILDAMILVGKQE